MYDYIASGIYASQLKQGQDALGSDLGSTNAQLRSLTDLVRKMALVNQALLELMKEKTGLSDEELRLKVREVDLRDGYEDGKLTAGPVVCPKCGFNVTAGSLSCQTCGAKIAPKYPYES
ncbi:zinc ribbon domain-containing protein [Haloferula rosea]|uniref:Uncharacterized protein n=1 Tax=Haloferula rosea TaxID=490093 RepID=A0A934RC23_9BACT|nr:zinc ribbon domain-containing protein [Haloferula rosea]MBK1826241.1 hypothetical protein [Haloferula rosea]